MCKNYIYRTICNNPICDTIVCQKGRNVYCREALDARRLGHCMIGVIVAGQFSDHESSARCRNCKSLPRSQSQSTTSTSSHSSTRDSVSLKCKRKAGCLFEHVFEFALKTEITNQQHNEPSWETDGTAEVYTVQCPETPKGSQQNKRRMKTKSGKSRGSPQSTMKPESLVDPYGLEQSYQIRETWDRRI